MEATAKTGKFKLGLNTRRNIIGYVFAAPAIILFIVFTIIPLILSVYLSFYKTDMFFLKMEFVGFWNFADLIKYDPKFWQSFGTIFKYVLMAVPLNILLSLAMASLLNLARRGTKAFRMLFYMPSVTSAVAASLVWMWLMREQSGLLNQILGIFGIPPSQWLGHSKSALFSITIITVWQGIGGNMLIFLAALQGMPTEVYEAAKIDGAGVMRRFRSLTLNFLKPTLFFILMMTLIGAFQLYDQVAVLTSGLFDTSTPVYQIRQNAFGDSSALAGYAAAQSLVLFAVIMVVTLIMRLGMRLSDN